jgi:hypothetical protein
MAGIKNYKLPKGMRMINSQEQVLDIISTGLTNFVNALGDTSMLEAGAMAYADNKSSFIGHIKTGDNCKFAFPSMVILPDKRAECFVAILNDKIIVAWRLGFFKKTNYSSVIPKNKIETAKWYISDQPGTRGATLLSITSQENTTFALPLMNTGLADLLLAAVKEEF